MENQVIELYEKIESKINQKNAEMTGVVDKLHNVVSELNTDFANQKGEITILGNTLKEAQKQIESNIKVKPISEHDENLKNLSKGIDSLKSQIIAGQKPNNILLPWKTKTVGDMTFATNVSGEIIPPYYAPGLSEIVKKRNIIRSLANVISVDSKVIKWVEELNEEGDADMTGENAIKKQIDTNYQEASTEAKKITDFVKVTTEMLDDIPWLSAQINSKLLYKIARKEEYQFLNGTGVGLNLNGIIKYKKLLYNTGLQNSITTGLANWYNVISAAIAQIDDAIENPPNAVLVNRIDYYKFVNASRATDGQFIWPPTVNLGIDGVLRIDGVPIFIASIIPAGYYLVADLMKFNIVDKNSIMLNVGWTGDDFIYNRVTILGEKRLCTYVELNDTEAFVYDTFANGITFIEGATT